MFKEKIQLNQNNPAYHQGAVLPPSCDGYRLGLAGRFKKLITPYLVFIHPCDLGNYN